MDPESQKLYFEQIRHLQQEAEYKTDFKDRYVGDIDPITKMRQGLGTYTYPNAFFQYQGGWENGKKHTQEGEASTLLMRDGSKYTGMFQNGEITGCGIKTQSNGRVYHGEFLEGEMHGQGFLQYNVEARGEVDFTYEGQFHLNSREGQGTLKKKNGDVYKGTFRANQPNGETEIFFHQGDYYKGEVVRGVMTGNGFLQKTDNTSYKGDFKEGKLHGEGTFYIENGTYSLTGKFNEGVPEVQASKYLLNIVSPEEEEEDPKAKKDPKKGAAAPVDEGEGTGNTLKILLDTTNPNEARRIVEFNVEVVFQGEPYEDPNPPEEEEAKGKKKGGKEAAAEPEVRMITPPPIPMDNEQGREFQIELGRFEQVPIKKSENGDGNAHGESAEASIAEGEQEMEKKWILYKIDQKSEEMVIRKTTEGGKFSVGDLTYKLDPESFPSGTYEIVITDVTRGIEDSQKLAETRIDLKLIDSEAEAELAATQAAAGKQKKK